MNPKSSTTRLLILLFCLGLLLAACGSKPTPAAPADKQPGYPAATGSTPSEPTQVSAYPNPQQQTENQPVTIPESAYPSPGLSIQLVKPDGSTVTVSGADLRNMPLAQITAADQPRSGILLGALLNAQGITEFQQVVVTGSGGNLTLSKDKVTQDVILSFNEDGSAQLISADLPEDQWVKGVNKIDVK